MAASSMPFMASDVPGLLKIFNKSSAFLVEIWLFKHLTASMSFVASLISERISISSSCFIFTRFASMFPLGSWLFMKLDNEFMKTSDVDEAFLFMVAEPIT